MLSLAKRNSRGPSAARPVALGVFLLLGLLSGRARAEPSDTPPDGAAAMREYPLSVRPLNVGFGAGDVGFGFRAGSAVEFWVNDLFGVGLQGGVTEQRMLFGPMSGAAFVEPTVGMRSSPHSGTYLVATLGVGYARGQYDSGSGFCVLSPCSSPVKYSYDGHAVSAAAGVLFHPGRGYFELGPSLRLDAIGGDVLPKDTLFTLNFEVGFALPRR